MLTIPERTSKKRQLLWISALMLLAVVFIWSASVALASFGGATATAFSTDEVSKGAITRTVNAYGRLQPRNSSTVIAEVNGTVETIHVFPGEQVEAGQVIVTLTNPSLLRQAEQAELSVLEAQASQNSTKASLMERQVTLENDLALLKSEIGFAQKELDTKAFLLEEAIVAKLDYLRSETSLEQTKLKYELQQRKIDAFSQSKEADLKAADYRYQEAHKQLEMARYDIDQLQVRAKRSGTLSELNTDLSVGASIDRGQALAQVTNPAHLYADLLVAAQDANGIIPGQTVQVLIRDRYIDGQVLRVYPSAENNQVRIEVSLQDQLPPSARANLNVSATINTEYRDEVLRIPVFEGISRSHSPVEVFARSQDKFYKRTLQLGVVGDKFAEVVSGAKPGDQILTHVPAAFAQANIINVDELNDD
ncbi:efflux RND transporter periplasmic adaptor subunit [Idiomarina sp.]|uniref:efflux RND transporter periplasmic adaptor subunit n=1 Tax=Idiomarina sp. TaxID=1874361 RepID=UPI0025C26EEA|nr:HlyD family efflux transporter periplasmic adaptor subunit [Idiomarina sp.]NQZ03504.1 HlyD family efflux transporter periplasmic adaptor subunit [Idiomarina sp.]